MGSLRWGFRNCHCVLSSELENVIKYALGSCIENIVVPVDIPLVSMNIVSLKLVVFLQSLSCSLLLVKIMFVSQVLACE